MFVLHAAIRGIYVFGISCFHCQYFVFFLYINLCRRPMYITIPTEKLKSMCKTAHYLTGICRTESKFKKLKKVFLSFLRNPERDISFPIFIRKEFETRKLERKSKQKISRLIDLLHVYRLYDFLSFLSSI